jgi:hypothetical protein
MGGGGRNRKQQNIWNTTAQQQNAAITTPDPLEQKWKDRQLAVLNWEDTPGKDIRDMPGMDSHIQIGRAALDAAGRDRQATGLNLADTGSNGYATQLKELKRNELGQQVGAGLENARAGIHAEAAGSVLPLSQLSTQRKLGQAQHSAQMFGQWNQRKSKNWWDYLTDTVGMAQGFM